MAEPLQVPLADVIGDDAFTEAIRRHAAAAESMPPGEIPPDAPTITVDASGNVIGDTSSIDPHILAQLQTPESQKQIADIYRRARYRPEPPRPPRLITEIHTIDPRGNLVSAGHQRRDLSKYQIAPGRLGRRLLRQYLRKKNKIERASAKGETPNGG